jgi:sRNA-binding carbon storage regulator CsrA
MESGHASLEVGGHDAIRGDEAAHLQGSEIMLVLRRDRDQRINLYLNTEHGKKLLGQIVMVDVVRQQAKLGFEFGSEVSILRAELEQPVCAK